MTRAKVLRRLSLLLVAAIVSVGTHTIAQPSLDTTFTAGLTKTSEGEVQAIFPQPDGKIFVTGSFNTASGKSRPAVVKLNADGTVDQSFYPPDIRTDEPATPPARVFDLAIQSTGKILLAGEFYTADGQSRPRLIRLNADGSLDPTFAVQPMTWVARDLIVLADDKIIVGGGFQYLDPSGTRNRIVRLNADGTLDTSLSFSPEPDSPVSKMLRQADGKLVVAYGNKVVRYTTAGALDPTFGPIECNQPVVDIEQQADGKIIFGGYFGSVNSFPMAYIFRTSADGMVDGTFSSDRPNLPVLSIEIAADQRILVAGFFSVYDNTSQPRVAILDANGNLTDIHPSGVAIPTVFTAAFQGSQVLMGGATDPSVNARIMVRLSSGLNEDGTFQPMIGRNGIGARLLVQPDGKILAAGQFRVANLSERLSIARFNSDGLIDTGFVPPTFNVHHQTLLSGLDLQPDEKILVVGTSPVSSRTEERLNPNGSYEGDLLLGTKPRDVQLLPNGQILVGYAGTVRRMHPNRFVDSSFNPTVTGEVYRIVLQPDGRILIGGNFTQVNGSARNGIARLNFDGTLDATFNPNGGANGLVSDIALQPDGKIIIAGEFTGVNFDTNRKYVARLNADGSLDTSYAPVINAPVYALKLQPDGRLLIGGDMTVVNGATRNRIARLHSNGSLEPTLNVSVNDTVLSIEQQADGKILYAGDFTRTNGLSTVGIGRLTNPAVAVYTPFDFDGDGRADISVFRSSSNRWYEVFSSTGGVVEETFGSSGDILAPADFDGDGITDEAIFRPSNGQWWYKRSIDGALIANPFGSSGDIPRPSDFDGDGKADLVIFRPSNSTWYRYSSLTNQEVAPLVFGVAGDQPLVGDFDGDGKADPAIFRPSNGDWWYAASASGGAFRNVHWGQNGDIPVPADFDGDLKTDFAVFRPSDGGWYIFNSGTGTFTTTAFGTSGDRPIAADYDGDGRADIAVFRPSTGIWYLLRSTAGFAGYQFGISTDVAIPGSLLP